MNTNFVITYYKNRKLYSQDASRYVNLKECKELIDAGYNVKFVAHKTGEDVTEHCLKEMLCKFSISQDILIKLVRRSNEKE
jgi:polyhydroxyalkanoate synthesis regulator protein